MGVFEEAMSSLGLAPRPQQVKLVDYARQASANDDHKFVQAGTGTGKSYAILTTALETSRETGVPSLVICPNNSLIDQYVNKDAPEISRVVGGDFVHIKGRSRYVCANSKALQRTGSDRTARQEYRTLVRAGKLEWAELGLDYTFGCPGSPDCGRDTSIESDFCPQHGVVNRDLDQSCACEYVCGSFEAKKRAMAADVVITNAHVLVWDHLVRGFTQGGAQLLPDVATIFVDECHELESIGRECLSDEIKPGSSVYEAVNGLSQWAQEAISRMVRANQTEALLSRSPHLVELANQAREDAKDLENRANTEGVDFDLAKEYRREAKRLTRFVDFVAEHDDFISIIELAESTNYQGEKVIEATLKRRCVNAAPMFNQILAPGGVASVLVSGTIPSSAPRRLGLKATVENVGHPFDYSKSTLAISPHSPKDQSHFIKRVEQVAAAINDTGGGTLLLFTSWADLESVVPAIARRLSPGIDVYVQPKDDPAELKQDIEDFKADGNAVLVGVRSLFTGLDIPGPALRQVILWKLPYEVPTLEWKAIQAVHGRSVYFDSMLTVLTQAIGRLVRSVDDSGRVFIVDNRAANQRWRSSHMTAHVAEFSAHRRPQRS